MINKVDHIGIAVHSLDDSLPFYTDVLGLEVKGVEMVQSEQVRVAFVSAGNVMLELLEPLNNESVIFKFLEKRGEGIHHLALGVTDIETRIKELKERGIKMIHEVPKVGAHQAKVAFMHPKSTRSILMELCQRS